MPNAVVVTQGNVEKIKEMTLKIQTIAGTGTLFIKLSQVQAPFCTVNYRRYRHPFHRIIAGTGTRYKNSFQKLTVKAITFFSFLFFNK